MICQTVPIILASKFNEGRKILSSMELGSTVEFLNKKSILVIGATGFLAKSIVPSQKKFISSRLTNL